MKRSQTCNRVENDDALVFCRAVFRAAQTSGKTREFSKPKQNGFVYGPIATVVIVIALLCAAAPAAAQYRFDHWTADNGLPQNYDWNLSESNKEFERAIELNPNYPNAHHWYARENLTIMGNFERALAEMRRAQELDPLSLIINANLGKAYFNARRYDEAIQQLRKTIEIDPTFFVAHHYLGSAYAMKGDYSDALSEYQKAHQLNESDPHVVALTGRLYAVTGKRTEALGTIAQLKSMATERYVPDYSIALVYAALGDKDQAFSLLEKSYQDHTVDMLTLYYDPLIDNLRSDPRFTDLQRRVGLK